MQLSVRHGGLFWRNPGVRQLLIDHAGEHVVGLRAADEMPVDEEGRRATDAEFLTERYVAVDVLAVSLVVVARSELFGVEVNIARQFYKLVTAETALLVGE